MFFVKNGKKSFVKRIKNNILYIDLVCHGVPSYHLYDKYKQSLSNEYGLNPSKTINIKTLVSVILKIIIGFVIIAGAIFDDFAVFCI